MPTLTPSGIASFQIGNAANTLIEIGDQCEVITPELDQEEFTGSSFAQTGTLPNKTKGYGAVERTYTLRIWWNQTIDDLMESISGMTGRNFVYGPEGTGTGKRKYSGTVNVGAWLGPGEQNASGNFMQSEIELSIVTRVVGTF